jgi:hypothetical protein
MLTLLKQARAFGLGIVLATQNPVDLDYKGLSNIGTWFLGRLQTERDKMRVIEGLEGAAAQTGQTFDRRQMEQTLAGLGSRVFLMNNVHEDGPQIFQTRWAMSFLAGPLARAQISELMAPAKAARQSAASSAQESVDAAAAQTARPIAPAGIEERFVAPERTPRDGARCVYRPAVLGRASLHYVRSSADLDLWRDEQRWVACGSGLPASFWEASEPPPAPLRLSEAPEDGFGFTELPAALCGADQYGAWAKQLKEYLYRHCPLVLYKSPLLKEYAPVGTSEAEARLAFTQQAREARDREIEKLRAKYASRMDKLDKRIRSAEERVAREREQFKSASVSSVISLGQTILGTLMGNKLRSRSTVSRAGAIARGASRAARQQNDVERAEESLRQLSLDMMDLDAELRGEIAKVQEEFDVEHWELDSTKIAPRKGDLKVEPPELVWAPWQVDAQGIAEPLY